MKKKFVIQIIDDNKNFVIRMIELLNEPASCRDIKVASNYDEANDLFSNTASDMILLDINLPGKSGIEILRHIKENNIPGEVIMMTNHTDDYYKDQCKKLGAKYFMDKSYDFGLIPDMVKKHEERNRGIVSVK